MENTMKSVSKVDDRNFWKPNVLIMQPDESQSIYEYRIMLHVHTTPYKDLISNRTVYVDIDDINHGQLSSSRYTQINAAIESVLNFKYFKSKKGNKEKGINIVSMAEYVDVDRGTRRDKIAITINSDAIPFLKDVLSEGFTKLPRDVLMRFKRVSSGKLAEMLFRFSSYKKEFIISLDDLRFVLNVKKGKLERWVHFNQRVLTPVSDEINSEGTITFTHTPIKKGKKIISVLFKIIEISIPVKKYDKKAVAIVKDHIWENSRNYVLDNYSKAHIEYYHNKCHKEEKKGKIVDLDSFVFRSITEDADDFKTIEHEKDVRESKAAQKEREDIAYEKHYRECFNLLPENKKQKYIDRVNWFSDKENRVSVAMMIFEEENRVHLKQCKNPDEFIRL